jgi:hypothetical protein
MRKYSITVYYDSGVGTTYENIDTIDLHLLIDNCLFNNRPFTVGHIFGNIDGTHPKRKD